MIEVAITEAVGKHTVHFAFGDETARPAFLPVGPVEPGDGFF
jgi:hypothetical protein